MISRKFPARTVSPQGGTKIRAMQIIADLEGTTRGPYGRCVGYFSFNGNLDTCITIRAALRKPGKESSAALDIATVVGSIRL